MTFVEACHSMIDNNIAIKRENWHYSIFFVEDIEEWCTGYNNETIELTIEDYKANDWVLDK